MRITIERLRTWILVLAGVLVVAILGFFLFTRYKLSHVGRDLPARLGVNIQQDANGFTYSKSQGGHTLFTLHASKLIQYKGNGRATLHNVSITLYGKDGSRNDHVYGDDFEYDAAQGTARALGPVHLDVQAPAGTRGTAPQNRTVHAETSGLVFNQKTGEARTDAPVAFSVADAKGTAVGAAYDANEGVLILQQDVHFTAQLTKGPLALVAEHAEFNRDTRQLALLKPDARYAGEHNTAAQALVYFRPDGTVEKADASGHVNMQDEQDRELHASAMEVVMDAHGNTQRATLDGGLLFSANEGPHSIHGDANSGILQLGPDGELKRVEMHSAVTVVDQEIGPVNDPHGSVTREVRGSTVIIDLVTSPQGHAEAEKLMASGNAVLTEHTIYSDSPPQNTVMKGDVIQATLHEGRALDTLRGQGNTFLTNTNPSGVSQTSTGDTLDIAFAQEPEKEAKLRPNDIPPSLIERAVQRGHVTIVQVKPGATDKKPWRSQATADIATLDGPRQIIHLEGSPRLNDEEAEMTAQMIDFYRLSGAVTADHDVKVTFRQGASAQAPVHAVAEKVFFDHDRDEAILYGGAQDARLWQAANSVAASTIVLDRQEQTLIAPEKNGEGRVHGVFADTGSTSGSKATGSEAVIRVDANSLQYSAAERRATFQGNVVAQQANGRLRADRADLFMTKNAVAGAAAQRVPNPRGTLDHMIAEGKVQVDEGVRKGEGERLVYTASDGKFVLYGHAGRPAHMADPEHGTVSGSALIFTNRGDSVEVDGGNARAVTDTQVPK